MSVAVDAKNMSAEIDQVSRSHTVPTLVHLFRQNKAPEMGQSSIVLAAV